ncbi:DUF4181 domain-containing protein [Oceanobacillus kapialis]|uniref:DUF4181 domain-containing protein n=1 Tax=Oceanobacillus kapialis TaxID=481353 RepID=A0ABW5Q3Q6_9BACI
MYNAFDLGPYLIKVILLLIIVMILHLLERKGLNKLFRTNKKFYSYNHVNRTHQVIDWMLRISMVFPLFYFIYQGNWKNTVYAILIFAVVQESVRAFMEWKHIRSKKFHYITLIELAISILFILLLIYTEGFGLFDI